MHQLANIFFPSSVSVKGIGSGSSATSATNIPPAVQALPAGTIIKGNVTGRNPAGDMVLTTPQGDLALKTNIFMKRGVEVSIKLEKAMDELMAKILTIDNKSVSKYVNGLQNKQAGSEVLLQSTLQAMGKTDASGTVFTSSTPLKALLMPKLQQELQTTATQTKTGQALQTGITQSTPTTSTPYGNAASAASATPQLSQQAAAGALSNLNYSAHAALSALPPKIAAIIAAATQGAELEVKVKSIHIAPPAPERNKSAMPAQKMQPSINTPQPTQTTPTATIPANQTNSAAAQPQTIHTQTAQPTTGTTIPPSTPSATSNPTVTPPINTATAQTTPTSQPTLAQTTKASTGAVIVPPARHATATTTHVTSGNDARSTVPTPVPKNISTAAHASTAAQPSASTQPSPAQTAASQTTSGHATSPTASAAPARNPHIQTAPTAPNAPTTSPQTAAYNTTSQVAAPSTPTHTTQIPNTPLPTAQPIADTKATIPAIVIQASPNSAQTLQTPLGTLRLFIPTPLPLGTQLQLEVTAATPQALSAGMVAESIKELGGFDELQQINLVASAEGKPPLATIPQAGGKDLTTDMLFFLTALKGGDVKKWLGDRTSKALENNSSELLSRLTSEFGQLRGNQVEAKEPGQWNLASIPMAYGEDVSPVHMYYRHNERESDENVQHDHTDHFVVDVNLTNLGAIQFDGFMTKPDNKKLSFDLLVRTDTPLPDEVQQGIRTIYQDAQAITGFNGSMGFRVGANARLDLKREIAAQGNSQSPPPDTDALIV